MTDSEIQALMHATATEGYPSDVRKLIEALQPEIDCRQCVYGWSNTTTTCKYCTNGDKFEKLPVVQLWRKG